MTFAAILARERAHESVRRRHLLSGMSTSCVVVEMLTALEHVLTDIALMFKVFSSLILEFGFVLQLLRMLEPDMPPEAPHLVI